MKTEKLEGKLTKMLADAKTIRDSLRVEAHLGGMALRDKLRQLEASVRGVERGVALSLSHLGMLADEVRLRSKLAGMEIRKPSASRRATRSARRRAPDLG